MEDSPARASEILWIGEDEHYFVCSECLREWGARIVEPDDFSRGPPPELHETLEEQEIDCELCEYDKVDMALKVGNPFFEDMPFEDVPDHIKGDVFETLVAFRTSSVDEEERESTREELREELGLDSVPCSIHQRQSENHMEALERKFDEMVEQQSETASEIVELSEELLDAIVAREYGLLLAEYETAMSQDLWTTSHFGLFSEISGKIPGAGFLLPFGKSILEEIRISKDAEKNRQAILEHIDEIERQFGSSAREELEEMLEQDDKRLGRAYLLMMIAHHKALKQS